MIVRLTIVEFCALVVSVLILGSMGTEPIRPSLVAKTKDYAGPTEAEWKCDELLETGIHKLWSKHFDDALADFVEASKLDPKRAACHHRIGQTQMVMGRLPAAVATLDTALRLNPGDPQILDTLATVQLLMGRPTAALRTTRLALQRAPAVSSLWETLGWAYASKMNFVEAQAAFRQALQVDPRSDGANKGLQYLDGSGGSLFPLGLDEPAAD